MSAAPELLKLEEVEGGLESLGWSIKDLVDLDWALSRLASIEHEVAENLKLEEEAINRVRLKTEVLNERLEKGASFFRNIIEAYANTNRDAILGGGKKKSRTLLHGTLGWRKTGGRLEVTDPAAALAWAQEQPVETGVLRIKEELDKKALNALHEKTGEVPPGCDVIPEGEELQIKPVAGGVNHEQ